MPNSRSSSKNKAMGALVLVAGVLGVAGVVGFSTIALNQNTYNGSQAYGGTVAPAGKFINPATRTQPSDTSAPQPIPTPTPSPMLTPPPTPIPSPYPVPVNFTLKTNSVTLNAFQMFVIDNGKYYFFDSSKPYTLTSDTSSPDKTSLELNGQSPTGAFKLSIFFRKTAQGGWEAYNVQGSHAGSLISYPTFSGNKQAVLEALGNLSLKSLSNKKVSLEFKALNMSVITNPRIGSN